MHTQSNDAYSLHGKVAIVTGGASGIGIGIATVLAEAGATVVIADRDETRMAEVVNTLEQAGHNAGCVHMDLADESSIVRGCADIVARFGTPWALVNNAGLQDREPLLDGTAAEWDRMNAVNARGPFLTTREVARAMVAHGQGGRIINIGTNGLRGMIAKGHAPYLGSKGALLALSHASAFELIEHRITVNTVLPGATATPGAIGAKGPTPEGPARRPQPLGLCDPRDIGCAVRFFATPAAHRITNQTVAVDGGFSLT
jgi:NAD(P)-dependent dehydrogenase (short-subunit alcohol dehydrogenase family)